MNCGTYQYKGDNKEPSIDLIVGLMKQGSQEEPFKKLQAKYDHKVHISSIPQNLLDSNKKRYQSICPEKAIKRYHAETEKVVFTDNYGHQYYVMDTAPDGNCYFHATAPEGDFYKEKFCEALDNSDNQKNLETIRKQGLQCRQW